MKIPFEFDPFRLSAAAVLTALALMAGAPFVSAQDNQVRAQPTRLTVQAGQSGVITNTIYVIANSNQTINLAVDGTLPTGVTSATLNTTSFVAPADTRLFSSATLTVNYTGSVPQTGANEIVINASGGYTYRLPVPINSAVIWAGNTNNNAFASAGNWEGGSVPTGSDGVVFGSAGAAPAFNDDDTSPGFFTNSITNVVISSDLAVSGVRFSHGAVGGANPDPDARYRVEIQPGASFRTPSIWGAT